MWHRPVAVASLVALLTLPMGASAQHGYGSHRHRGGWGGGAGAQPAKLPIQFARGEADPYALLGLGHSAKEAEVGPAYRRAARDSHPDKTGDTEAFLLVKDAYEVLKSPALRREYDMLHQTSTFAKRPRPRPASTFSWMHTISWETVLWSVVCSLGGLWAIRPFVAAPTPAPKPAPKREERPRRAEQQPPKASPAPVRRSARVLARSALVYEEGMLPSAGAPSSLGRCVVVVLTEDDASSGAAWEWIQKAADAIRPEMRVVWGTTLPDSCGAGRVAQLANSRGVGAGSSFALSVQLRGGRVVTAAKPLDVGVVGGKWSGGPALLAWCERVVGGEVRHLAE